MLAGDVVERIEERADELQEDDNQVDLASLVENSEQHGHVVEGRLRAACTKRRAEAVVRRGASPCR